MLSSYVYLFFFFFFSSRRRHTRCSRDWSSDVCSSDLAARPERSRPAAGPATRSCRGAPWGAARCLRLAAGDRPSGAGPTPPAATGPTRSAPRRVRATTARGTRAGTPSGNRRAGRRAARVPSGVHRACRTPGAAIPGPEGYAVGTASAHSAEARRVRAVHAVALRERLEVAGEPEQIGRHRARRRYAGELGVARQELGHDVAGLLRLE